MAVLLKLWKSERNERKQMKTSLDIPIIRNVFRNPTAKQEMLRKRFRWSESDVSNEHRRLMLGEGGKPVAEVGDTALWESFWRTPHLPANFEASSHGLETTHFSQLLVMSHWISLVVMEILSIYNDLTYVASSCWSRIFIGAFNIKHGFLSLSNIDLS